MVSKEVVVNNGTGLHARPATLLVKKASSFKSDFQRDNERESCSDGKKDTGKLSGRTAA